MIVSFLQHTWYLTLRLLRRLYRQPWYIALTLIQPLVWLIIFGQLFKRIVEIPGFQSGSYLDFLAPGVVIMSALFSSGWSGMGMIDAINRGIMDRFLVSPASRAALIVGSLLYTSINTVIQSTIIITIGFLAGAHFPGGMAGIVTLIVSAILLSAGFSAISNGIALLARREETVIATVNFIAMPLMFLSPVLMHRDLVPEWIKHAIQLNPVAWAVDAGRTALGTHPDWAFIAIRIGLLAVTVVIGVTFATRAFRAYQRSV